MIKDQHPYLVSEADLIANIDTFVTSVMSNLQSHFLEMPRGENFLEYDVFRAGYETLKEATQSFTDTSYETLLKTIKQTPICLVVLRTILGLTPPEVAYLTSVHEGIQVRQEFGRNVDGKAKQNKDLFSGIRPDSETRLTAIIKTISKLLTTIPNKTDRTIHRLDKFDTKNGIVGIQEIAKSDMVPYPVLLHERLLGRPFASHRDAVSEDVGDIIESAVEFQLQIAKIPYYKTKRVDRIPGFDQSPDFIIPSKENPQVVIEAKLTEDDGTARDKITRVQHLAELSEKMHFEVIAIIDGRGFGIRAEDMKKLLLVTKGKVFTLKTITDLVENSRLKEFVE